MAQNCEVALAVVQQYQPKILPQTADASWYVSNRIINTDLHVKTDQEAHQIFFILTSVFTYEFTT